LFDFLFNGDNDFKFCPRISSISCRNFATTKQLELNILVAEDNMFTAQQYNKILEKNGHNVILAKDGEECIQKFEQTTYID